MCVRKSFAILSNTLVNKDVNGKDRVIVQVCLCVQECVHACMCIYTYYTYIFFSDVNKLPVSIDGCFTVQELPVDRK